MAGHSQFKNIMHRKGAQDKKRGKAFTKIIREITTSTRAGSPDPNTNPRLRAAVTAARNANMPKDTIERAIKRGSGAEAGDNFEEIRYEGYGPGGVAIIIESLTDNRTRTAGEIRSAFAKHGGNLGESGSVGFMFERLGCISYPAAAGNNDVMFEAAIESGASDVQSDESGHIIYCASDDLNAVQGAMEKKFGPADRAKLAFRPINTTPVAEQDAKQLMDLIEVLEDNDDVQTVYGNYEIDDAVMEKLVRAG